LFELSGREAQFDPLRAAVHTRSGIENVRNSGRHSFVLR